ncbi:MAG TPA: hypothetical protein VF546_23490 [Pyrinomonadaceae bacterium]
MVILLLILKASTPSGASTLDTARWMYDHLIAATEKKSLWAAVSTLLASSVFFFQVSFLTILATIAVAAFGAVGAICGHGFDAASLEVVRKILLDFYAFWAKK